MSTIGPIESTPAPPVEVPIAAAPPRAAVFFAAATPYLVAALAVAASTGVSFVISTLLAPGSLTLIYLTGVLLVAMSQGLWPSLLCSVLSYVTYSYCFALPLHSFHIASTQDWVDLGSFMAAALITGTLAAKVRSQLHLIRQTAEQNHRLYDFTRGIASAITRAELAELVRQHVSVTLNCQTAVLLTDAHGTLADEHAVTVPRRVAEDCMRQQRMTGHGTPWLPDSPWSCVPMGGAGRPLGVLAVRVGERSAFPDPGLVRLLLAMRDQTVIALERIDLAAHMEQAQLLKETERLREALLSSVSHDLRTPLASIIGAATTLRDLGGELRDSQREELLETVIDEASRLNRFVQNLLDMTRIGYGALRPRLNWTDLREVIGQAVRSLSHAHPGREVCVHGADQLPQILTDAALLERVFFNLLDNAAKYSPPGQPIDIGIGAADGRVTVAVTDTGPGIPPDERERVFDMFHHVQRGDATPSGTGLGLSICRGLTQALGGNIAATAGPAGRGTSMILNLPVNPAIA